MLEMETKPVSRVRHYSEFHCISDWVLMAPEGVRETEGGILLPDSAEEEFQSRDGKCVSKGDGVLVENGDRVPLLAVVGRRYNYLTYTKRAVKVNGKEYDLVRDRDLVGFYE